ncbi:MAG: outer membrane beta-barrel protein [Salibacteraceae bacterium]|jgi:hypothetical protein|nr:outer membrane beta-barrel protein [Salibacteraceae bacterium]MDP4764061.1 outer membrane beta-barrel protein [Salibacteraceae bacterium]MDP4965389.1 outer membrane beta-barrel protein [Salibacteraceae bacterium]
MANDNNIDQLFKQKLAGREAAGYSASAWAGAEKALGSHFRMLLFKKVAFIAIPLLIATGAATYWYTNQTEQETQQATTANQQPMVESIAASETIYSSSDKIETSTQTSATSNYSSANASEDFASSDNNSEAGALASNTDSKANSANVTNKNSAKSTNKSNSKANAAFAESNSEPTSVASAAKAKNQVKKADGSNELLGDMSHNPAAFKNQNTTQSFSSISSFDLENFDRLAMSQMPIYNMSSLGKTKAKLSAESNAQETILLKEARKLEFAVNGGLIFANKLENNLGSRDKIGLGAYAGLNVHYHLKPRMFLYCAVTLNTRNSLGSESQSNNPDISVFPSQLIYLDIPLHIGYRFGARHEFSFGMTFSPLITAMNEDRHVEDYGANPTTSFSSDGFANFDAAGSVIYSINLTHRIDFNASIRFGLFDVTDDSYFKTALIDDRNHQLRIGINYKLRTR